MFLLVRSEPATFVKELIYRSLERHNLDKVYRQIQELRKRLRTREQKAVSFLSYEKLLVNCTSFINFVDFFSRLFEETK